MMQHTPHEEDKGPANVANDCGNKDPRKKRASGLKSGAHLQLQLERLRTSSGIIPERKIAGLEHGLIAIFN